MIRRSGIAAAAIGALALSACTQSQSDVANALSAYGMTSVKAGSYDFFACASKEDEFSTSFTAVNAQGARVAGVLCAGFLKGSTVRNLHVVSTASAS